MIPLGYPKTLVNINLLYVTSQKREDLIYTVTEALRYPNQLHGTVSSYLES